MFDICFSALIVECLVASSTFADISHPAIRTGIQKDLENLSSDFSKYSLIRNKFRTQQIQRKGLIYELF